MAGRRTARRTRSVSPRDGQPPIRHELSPTWHARPAARRERPRHGMRRTVIIVAVMLMGAFGPTDGFFARMLKPIFFAFGPSTAGTIYSFGYTLLVGVLLNFVFGVICTRVMLKGISKLKCMRNPVLYGGVKNEKTV